jgi:hypothetical protein
MDFNFGYFQGLWLFARWRERGDLVFAVLSVGLVLAAVVFIVGIARIWQMKFARGFVLLALVVPVAAGYLLACKTYYHQTRYFMTAYPAFAILFATGLVRLYERWRAVLVPALLLTSLITLVSLGNCYFAYAYQRDDWRGVARYVQRQAKSEDLILFNAPYMDIPFRHYAHRPFHALGLPRPAMTSADVERILREKLERHSRIHLILCYWEVGDPDAMVRRCLDKLCQRQRKRRFAGIDVVQYQRRMRDEG